MKNLPRSQRDISVLFEELRQRYQIRQSITQSFTVRVVITPDSVRSSSCHEGAPAGSTQSNLSESIGEDETPLRQTVKVRSQHHRRTEVTSITQGTNVRPAEKNKLRITTRPFFIRC